MQTVNESRDSPISMGIRLAKACRHPLDIPGIKYIDRHRTIRERDAGDKVTGYRAPGRALNKEDSAQ
ncbi:hypothetical protein BDZ89DRAFT_1071210 [Hymenopellis radicata]|nr:hypothetical protein BDZ89DRAFT_1071210 [Hymenopellis radicata]